MTTSPAWLVSTSGNRTMTTTRATATIDGRLISEPSRANHSPHGEQADADADDEDDDVQRRPRVRPWPNGRSA